MYPIRWIYPCALLLFCSIYYKRRTKGMYFISFIFFATGILWNPDFGIINYLTLLAFYSFIGFEEKNNKKKIIEITKHILTGIVSIVIAFSIYSILIKLFYGNFPDLSKLFTAINIFSFIGYNMLPMPLTFHPWMIIALIYITGLVS